jgi:hypothetical protein
VKYLHQVLSRVSCKQIPAKSGESSKTDKRKISQPIKKKEYKKNLGLAETEEERQCIICGEQEGYHDLNKH